MFINRNKFILILLLTLLQCFAPLLHAHTHGLSAVSGVHIDGMDELVVADYRVPAFTSERDDAPAIYMAQEYRQDTVIALFDGDQPALATQALSFAPAFFLLPFLAAAVVTAPPGGPLNYSRPFSQAPPTKLI